ncbi:MAG: exodeoxyribonuclease VII small subunit [Bacteroidales bacterium]|nr:exodeoxyribonuclease VII small subunit [Bacteroidales bacterium]
MTKKTKSYSEAIAQIEEILQLIENGELDVDQLAEKVKQVAELLKICRSKLFETEKEIGRILKEMDREAETEALQ